MTTTAGNDCIQRWLELADAVVARPRNRSRATRCFWRRTSANGVDADGFADPVIPLYRDLGMDVMRPFEVAAGCDVPRSA